MDGWGGMVLAIEILLLVAGWLLFQQAKTELTARMAQVPVITELKELKRVVATMLEQLKMESSQISAQLEARCMEARELINALDRRMDEVQKLPIKSSSRRRTTVSEPHEEPSPTPPAVTANEAPSHQIGNPRHAEVLALNKKGETTATIAQRTGYSIGEVEMILSLNSNNG